MRQLVMILPGNVSWLRPFKRGSLRDQSIHYAEGQNSSRCVPGIREHHLQETLSNNRPLGESDCDHDSKAKGCGLTGAMADRPICGVRMRPMS